MTGSRYGVSDGVEVEPEVSPWLADALANIDNSGSQDIASTEQLIPTGEEPVEELVEEPVPPVEELVEEPVLPEEVVAEPEVSPWLANALTEAGQESVAIESAEPEVSPWLADALANIDDPSSPSSIYTDYQTAEWRNPEPKQPVEEESSFIDDMGHKINAAALSGIEGILRTGDTLFGDGVDGELIQQFKRNSAWNSEQVSQAQKIADQAEFFSSEEGETFGSAWGDWRAWTGLGASAVGSLIPMAVGGLATAPLKIMAGRAATAGLLSKEAAKKAGTYATTAAMAGISTAMVTGGVGGEVESQIQNMPLELLETSPAYQAAFKRLVGTGESTAEAAKQARAEVGKEVREGAMLSATIPALVLGTWGSAWLNKAMFGSTKQGAIQGLLAKKYGLSAAKSGAIEGAIIEGVSESLQGGSEKLVENVAIRGMGGDITQTRGVWEGVGEGAFKEGIGGGMVGGALGSRNRIEPENEVRRDPENLVADETALAAGMDAEDSQDKQADTTQGVGNTATPEGDNVADYTSAFDQDAVDLAAEADIVASDKARHDQLVKDKAAQAARDDERNTRNTQAQDRQKATSAARLAAWRATQQDSILQEYQSEEELARLEEGYSAEEEAQTSWGAARTEEELAAQEEARDRVFWETYPSKGDTATTWGSDSTLGAMLQEEADSRQALTEQTDQFNLVLESLASSDNLSHKVYAQFLSQSLTESGKLNVGSLADMTEEAAVVLNGFGNETGVTYGVVGDSTNFITAKDAAKTGQQFGLHITIDGNPHVIVPSKETKNGRGGFIKQPWFKVESDGTQTPLGKTRDEAILTLQAEAIFTGVRSLTHLETDQAALAEAKEAANPPKAPEPVAEPVAEPEQPRKKEAHEMVLSEWLEERHNVMDERARANKQALEDQLSNLTPEIVDSVWSAAVADPRSKAKESDGKFLTKGKKNNSSRAFKNKNGAVRFILNERLKQVSKPKAITQLHPHADAVKKALREGKTVPQEVLADYPSLAPAPVAADTETEFKPDYTDPDFEDMVDYEQLSENDGVVDESDYLDDTLTDNPDHYDDVGDLLRSTAEASEVSGNSVEDIQDQVTSAFGDGVAKSINEGKVKIVQSVADLPSALQAAGSTRSTDGIGNAVEGLYDSETGTTFLVADQLDAGNIKEVVLHETLHRALNEDTKLRKRLDSAEAGVRSVFDAAEEGKFVGSDAKIYQAAMGRVDDANTPSEQRYEEFMAYTVSVYNETPAKLSGKLRKAVKDIYANIRMALMARGVNIKNLSAADLNAISLRYLKGKRSVGKGKLQGNTQGSAIRLASKSGYIGKDEKEAEEWTQAVNSGLDMSKAARMKRAKAMGFDVDTTYYHGTEAEFDEFKNASSGNMGLYFTANKTLADMWGNDSRLVEVFIKKGKALTINVTPLPFSIVGRLRRAANTKKGYIKEILEHPSKSYLITDKQKSELNAGGFDSVYETGNKTIIVFNPNQIRSIDAAFNPDWKDSGKLLASDPAKSKEENLKEWIAGKPVLESGDVNGYDYKEGEGVVMKLNHGTTHEFNEFNAESGNKEGHWGAVNYFTTDFGDANANYSHAEGADLDSRVSDLAIELRFDDSFEGDADAAHAEATRQLVGDESKVLEVYVQLDNPFVTGGKQTWLSFTDPESHRAEAEESVASSYGEEVTDEFREEREDEIQDEIYMLQEQEENPIVEAVTSVAYDYDLDAGKILEDLIDYADEITTDQLVSTLRESDAILDAYTENGDLVSAGEVVAKIIEELGYDGIIMRNANKEFTNMDMASETTHVHVFHKDRNKIKSIEGNNTYNPNTGNIYKSKKPKRGMFLNKKADPSTLERRMKLSGREAIASVPELAEKMTEMDGDIDQGAYNETIDEFKPVAEYESVPEIATKAETVAAVSGEAKKEKAEKALGEVDTGRSVALRLDIPAYKDKGVWVVTVHDQAKTRSGANKKGVGKSISHQGAAVIQGDIQFYTTSEKVAQGIAKGGDKTPIAVMQGDYVHMSDADIKIKADEALKSEEWTQVGYDPQKHSYWFDRGDHTVPITSATEVIQIGNLILAKDAKRGKQEDFMYSRSKPNKSRERDKKKHGIDGAPARLVKTLEKIGSDSNTLLDKGRKIITNSAYRQEVWDARAFYLTKFRQQTVNKYLSFDTVLKDKKAAMLAHLSHAAGGVIESSLLYGEPVYDRSGAVRMDTTKDSIATILEPLGKNLDVFLAWMAGHRSQRLLDQSAENSAAAAALDQEAVRLKAEISRLKSTNKKEASKLARQMKKVIAASKAAKARALVTERLFADRDENGDIIEGTASDNIDSLINDPFLFENDTQAERDAKRELFETTQVKFESMHNAIVKIGVETGVISEQDAAIWAEEGFYVPFYRVADEVAQDNKGGGYASVSGLTGSEAYKKLKGSDLNLNDLLTNTMMNWTHIVSAGLQNQAAVQALKTASSPEMGLAKQINSTQFAKTKNPKVKARVDGKNVYYELGTSPEARLVFDSLTSDTPVGMNGFIMAPLRKAKTLLTAGVTASPEFKIANLIRDSIIAMAATGTSTNVFKNMKDGFKATADLQTVADMLAGGGSFGHSGYLHGSDPAAIRNAMARGIKGATILDTRGKLETAWDWYQAGGTRLENVNRAAEFVQQGRGDAPLSLLERNFAARDHLDHSRTGSSEFVRTMVQIMPFLNARMQGLDKLGRAGWGNDPQQRAQFKSVVSKYVMASLALYLHMRDDEEYKAAQQWERDAYHLVRMGDTMARIPRPFELGVIATVVERGAEFILGKQDGGLLTERMLHAITDTLAINPVAQAARPILEVYNNKSWFTGRPIESQSMRGSKVKRKKDSTTQAAIGIANVLDTATGGNAPLSPVEVDYLAQGYFGWMGATVMGGLDILLRPAMGKPNVFQKGTPDWQIQDYMVLGRFARDATPNNSKYITEFYATMKSMDETFADIKTARENGDFEEAQEIRDENPDYRLRKSFSSVRKQLSALSKEIRRVKNNRMMTDANRTAMIRRLEKRRNAISQRAMDRIE